MLSHFPSLGYTVNKACNLLVSEGDVPVLQVEILCMKDTLFRVGVFLAFSYSDATFGCIGVLT